MTLRGKVSRGVFWEGGAMLINRGVGFLVSLVLARLLAPEFFGLLAIAMLAINSLVFLQELGFSSALIYRQSDVDAAANTAHWTVIASSIVLYMVAFILAPLVAQFFRNPEVTPVLRVLALTIIISSLSRVPYTLLFKELDFRKKVVPEFVGSLVGNVSAVLLALAGWNIWALVAGELINASVTTITMFIVSPWRPRLQFEVKLFKELFGYGKHVAASQVLIFGVTNVDDLFVGRMLGDAALGYYGMAYSVSNTPATNITRLVTRVTFPAFSKMQTDAARMRHAYFEVVHRVALVAMPIALVTIVFASDFVHVLLTDKWAPAIVPMQILAVYGLIRSVAATMGIIFQSGGKPQWLSSIALWRLITMTALLYPAIRWGGLIGVCVLSVAVAIIDFVISAHMVDKIVQARMTTYWRLLAPLFVYSLLAAAIGYGAEQVLLSVGVWPVAALVIAGVVVLAVYGLLAWWRDTQVRTEGKKLLVWLRASRSQHV